MALADCRIPYALLQHTKDIWLRDFMPIRLPTGAFLSCRYEPGYLQKTPELITRYRQDIAPMLKLPVSYSRLRVDGGNILFSPNGSRVIVSDRVFIDNPTYRRAEIVRELENILCSQIIVIPSLKSDLTGHADGMVRFLDEHTVIGNHTCFKNGLEQRIKRVLQNHGIDVIDFPYAAVHRGISAVGIYLNYLETKRYVFFPIFGLKTDEDAVKEAREILAKPLISINAREIARDGGGLHCISWETE